jgi:hypothetical protein
MDHWNGIKAIMSYLKGTMYAKLVFDGRKDVKAYCDVDWANDKGDSRSIGGYVILMSGAAVSWSSKKHNVAATSTLEAEYISMYKVSREVEWLKMFENEVFGERIKPCTINVDNQGAKIHAERKEVTDRTKHIQSKYHKARDLVQKGILEFNYVSTGENVADVLTKNRYGPKIKKFAKEMGLRIK